ncbi:MAG: TetR/AcrR family transcriptional regulator [Pseudomonadota bacterium]
MTITATLSKREQSIADRKERIIAAARSIIAEQGYDALTTRGLAQAAGVTVPTLYNLVGDKEAIISAMAEHSVEATWARLDFKNAATPLEMADAVINAAYAELIADAAYSTGALIALQRLGIAFAYHPTRDNAGARAARRSVEMAEEVCKAARDLGLLRGNLCPRDLAVQMFTAYRAPLDDWLSQAIDDDEMLRRQRWGFYSVLASDAAEEFRAELLERIIALTNAISHEEEAA